MKYNQFSYISPSQEDLQQDFSHLGFDVIETATGKANLETFVRRYFVQFTDTDLPLSRLAADETTDLLTFFQSDRELTAPIFETVVLQLLGFVPGIDYTDLDDFINQLALPIRFSEGNLLPQLHHLLATRRKDGNTVVDVLVGEGLIARDNAYHYFNGKSLATFDTNQLIREVVYVETTGDTDEDGELDLVKVTIIRPTTTVKVPVMMTASPYHQGVNGPGSDKKLYQMEGDLAVKAAQTITVNPVAVAFADSPLSHLPKSPATETFSYTSTYTLNDYMLARGFASVYVSGIGTAGSTGRMTSGDYRMIGAYKSVIDWLNGRATAYTSHKREAQVVADWTTGAVTTTGISYLGTMSTGLATTGVDGLKVIIAEAGISSWYEYYRENGAVCSPGGYPGEDLDSLAVFTGSRALLAGDMVHSRAGLERGVADLTAGLDRETGDYNQFWEARNYLPQAKHVTATVVYTHGLQDWNVKPRHVYNILKALPDHVDKHAILHQGQHVYLNNWQSIDFRETINALLTQKILGQETAFTLPPIIWQDNSAEQTWSVVDNFGQTSTHTLPLGEGEKMIQNHYDEETFARYGKTFQTFKTDLFEGKANAITIDLPVTAALLLNGQVTLNLTLKSSQNKSLLSAQLLHQGKAKRHTDTPAILSPKAVDNGANFAREDLKELPFVETPYRVITKGLMNLQNREGLLTISDLPVDEWVTVELALQPTIYQLQEGDQLQLFLYTTDFEHTVRDNSDYHLTVDLNQSHIHLPY